MTVLLPSLWSGFFNCVVALTIALILFVIGAFLVDTRFYVAAAGVTTYGLLYLGAVFAVRTHFGHEIMEEEE